VEELEPRVLLSVADYVNPFIGTGGSGWFAGDVWPGADVPAGMLQWSPDTPSNIPGGYRYADNTIKGFGLDHFSGRGITYMEDVPLMPVPGMVTQSPLANPGAFRSTFSHANETASPGYYGVTLDSGVTVELTTTLRSGIGRFTFATGSDTNSIIVNIGGSVNGVIAGAVTIAGNEVTGWARTFIGGGSGAPYNVYFDVVFDQPVIAYGTWTGGILQPGSTSATGGQAGAYLTFDTSANPVVYVKTAISFVSVANAQLNLQTENPDWDFDAVVQAARAAWESRLNVIQVDGPSEVDKQIFYTALYHTMFHPNVFEDVNGQYLGFDNAVHTVPAGHHQYDNIPGWDQYRSETALLSFLAPDLMSDIAQSLVNDAEQGGGGLPRWEQINHNSDGMVGDGPTAIIATAYAMGAQNFDTTAALTAMINNAGVPGTRSDGQTVRTNLAEYIANGYIGQDHNGSSASYTLEYDTADFALSQFALALGDVDTWQTFLTHAMNWQNLFNPDTGYITPRNSDGTFLSISPWSETGFTESSQATYTWMVPFSLRNLFDMMGGNDAVVSRLDTHFTLLNEGPDTIYAFMGNEPEEGGPWAYDFAGAPWRTQDVVRRIQLQQWTTQPDGLPGNDDAGAISSWYVFSALGLYPDLPGVGGFVIGSPLFSSITVNLPGGQTLQINAPNAGDANPYVQDMAINGVETTSLWLTVDQILGNATTTLDFDLGNQPNTGWGSSPDDAPPSFGFPGTTARSANVRNRLVAQTAAIAWHDQGADRLLGSTEMNQPMVEGQTQTAVDNSLTGSSSNPVASGHVAQAEYSETVTAARGASAAVETAWMSFAIENGAPALDLIA
jgi:predicted alpha-1,2-mannosidase